MHLTWNMHIKIVIGLNMLVSSDPFPNLGLMSNSTTKEQTIKKNQLKKAKLIRSIPRKTSNKNRLDVAVAICIPYPLQQERR